MSEQTPVDRIRNRITKYIQNRQWDKAASEYCNLINFYPADPELQVHTGDAFYKANQGVSAIKYYLNAAELYEKDNLTENTIAILKKILKIKPSLMDVNIRLANQYVLIEKTPLAIDIYKKAMAFYAQRNEHEEELTVLKKLVEVQPKNLILHRKLADLYFDYDLKGSAIAEYKSLLKKIKKLGLAGEVENILRRLNEIDADNASISYELVELYYKTTQFQPAIKLLDKMAKLNPTDNNLYRWKGHVLLEIGDKNEALNAYKHYIKNNPGDIKIYKKLIRLFLDLNKPTKAIKNAYKLITILLRRNNRVEAEEVLDYFKTVDCNEKEYLELYVKLLGSLDKKELFQQTMINLIDVLTKLGETKKVKQLKFLLSANDSMTTVTQYMPAAKNQETSPGIKGKAIDELADIPQEQLKKTPRKIKPSQKVENNEDEDIIDELN